MLESQEDKQLSTYRALRVAGQIFKKDWKKPVLFALIFFFLPLWIFGLFHAARAEDVVNQLNLLKKSGIVDLIGNSIGYLYSYLFSAVFMWVIGVSFYLGASHIAVSQILKTEDLSLGDAFKKGLRAALPRGASGFLLLLLLFGLSQAITPIAIILACLGTMFPTLLVIERSTMLASLKSSLLLRYTYSRQKAWNVFFVHLGSGAFLYLMVILSVMLKEYLMTLDLTLGITHDLWTIYVPGMPFSWMYLIADSLSLLVLSLTLSFFPYLSILIYLHAKPSLQVEA